MSTAGQTLHNPISGESFLFIMTAEDTNGDFFQFEWTLRHGGVMPFAHIHPRQSETFEVLSGELTVWMDGRAEVVRAGGVLSVPRGTVHQPRNTGADDLRCRVTLRPALHTATMIEVICGLANDGFANKRGQPRFLRLAVLASAYPDEAYIGGLPIWVQRVGLRIGSVVGRRLGYRDHYVEYSGHKRG